MRQLVACFSLVALSASTVWADAIGTSVTGVYVKGRAATEAGYNGGQTDSKPLAGLGTANAGFSFSGAYSNHTTVTLESRVAALGNNNRPSLEAEVKLVQHGPAYIPYNTNPIAGAEAVFNWSFELVSNPAYNGPPIVGRPYIIVNALVEADTDGSATKARVLYNFADQVGKEIGVVNGQRSSFPLTSSFDVDLNNIYHVGMLVEITASGTPDDADVTHHAHALIDPTITLGSPFASAYQILYSPELASSSIPEPSEIVMLGLAWLGFLTMKRQLLGGSADTPGSRIYRHRQTS